MGGFEVVKRFRIFRIRPYLSHQAGVDVAYQYLANRIDAVGFGELSNMLHKVLAAARPTNVLVENRFVIDKDAFVQILVVLIVVVGDLAEDVLRA